MKSPPPNILWICTDQQRYDSLGCTGNPGAVTPHIDALAAAGKSFSRFIVANPVCMPSRASFFTGMMPSAHGVRTNGIPLANRDLVSPAPPTFGRPRTDSHLTTLPELLARNGYHTRSIGKLHLTPTQAAPEYRHPENHWLWEKHVFDDWHGPYYGFQHVDLTLHHGEVPLGHYRAWLSEIAPQIEKSLQSPQPIGPAQGVGDLFPGRVPEAFHHSTWIGDRTVEFLSSPQAKAEPFFLWMSFPDPHHPFTPPQALAEKFSDGAVLEPEAHPEDLVGKPDAWSRKGFSKVSPEAIRTVRRYTDAQIHLIDLAVGRAVQALKDNGLWENTIVLYTSDHGDFLGDFGLLRKVELPCNALNRVPCIIRDPSGRLDMDSNAPISGVDLFPTLCELAGIALPSDLDGRSLLRGGSHPGCALVQCFGDDYPHSLSIYDRDHRLSWFPAADEWECYDHRVDPCERINIYPIFRHTRMFAELRERLLHQQAATMHPSSGRQSCW